mgnify:CR=1 FL=1
MQAQEIQPVNKKNYSLQDVKELVGLDKSSSAPASAPVTAGNNQTPTANEELVEEGAFEEQEEGPTNRKPWEVGWVKLAVVGVPLGLIAMAFGFFLVKVTSMKLTESAEEAEIVVDAGEDATALKDIEQEEQIAQLKTSNALGNQSSVLDNQPRRTEIRPQTTPIAQPATAEPQQRQATPVVARPRPSVAAAPSTARSRPVAVSRTPATPRPVAVSRAPITARVASPSRVIPQSVVSTIQAPPATKIDPYDAWVKLAAVGSFGQVNDDDTAYTSAVTQASEDNYASGDIQDSGQPIPIMVSNRVNDMVDANRPGFSRETAQRTMPEYMEANDNSVDELTGQAALVKPQPDELTRQSTLVETQSDGWARSALGSFCE